MRALPLLLIALVACGDEPEVVLPPPRELPALETLPEALVSFSGESIDTPDAWRERRRPELLRLFQNYVYGFVPPPAEVSATPGASDLLADGVRYEEVTLRYGPEGTPPIHLAIFRPDAASGPVPVFVAPNPCGNQSLIADDRVRLTESPPGAGCPDELVRGERSARWPIAEIVARGYALAAFHESDVDPDDARDRNHSDGVHPHFQVDAPEDAQWGTLAAWAYGVTRVVDYLQGAPGIDPARIASVGHSRRGKVALLAAALDERIALAIPHQSGTGGATLSRSDLGESVLSINTIFPHWFDRNFRAFGNNEVSLPVDQHLLIALVAPRAVFVTNGDDDDWADPPGALRAVEAAAPVWRFLTGEDALVHDAEGRPTMDGRLSWASRPGGHDLLPSDWQLFMDFADLHL